MVLLASSCRGRGGADNLLQLQADAPAGNLHGHLFKEGAPVSQGRSVIAARWSPCRPAGGKNAGSDSCVCCTLELSAHPGKLYECFPCSPGGLFELNVNKDSCFGLYPHCICLLSGPGENGCISAFRDFSSPAVSG